MVVVRVIVEPLVVPDRAPGTPMDRSAEDAHPLVDGEGHVLADVGDDSRLAGAEHPRGLVARFIARVRPTEIGDRANRPAPSPPHRRPPRRPNRAPPPPRHP